MVAIAEQRLRTLHAGVEMRPRRWYTDEHAPPPRAARITSELWRYRSLAQRRTTTNAAPFLERRWCLCPSNFVFLRGSFVDRSGRR
jgi:hypothetical protein